jgi:NTE family protein
MVMNRFLALTFILIVVVARHACSQHYKNLVFEGAGIRGIAYAGAIRELEERSMLKDVEKVAGTSAGAIAALTVALNYSSSEMEKIINDTKLQKFNDGKFFFIGGISRLNRNYGWYRGKTFTKWIGKIIASKTGDAGITFQEMHEKGFRDLYVTGTSLNNQKLIVFSYETYPEMTVRDAIRISISIPLYFEAVCIDSKGQVVDPKKTKTGCDIMVDGGFTGNFPISVFDSLFHDTPFSRKVNPHTLGFRMDTPDQIAYDTINKGLAPVFVGRLSNYINAVYNYVLENLNRSTLTKEDWFRTVSISSGNIGPKIRRLSDDEKAMLVRNGQSAMRNFLIRNALVTD